MGNGPLTPPQNPIAANSSTPTVEVVPGYVKMFTISEDKLDMLVSGASSLHWTFFGISFGAFLSFATIVFNGGLDDFHKIVYLVLLWPSGILSAFFGIRAVIGWFQSQQKLKEIKGNK